VNPVLAALLPAALAFIMLGLGLKLTPADFRRVLARPAAVGVGLVAQCLLLPLLAFGVAVVLQLEPATAVGLMILAACPGGVTAAMITDLAGGDTCLSITLTAATSLVAFISVPAVAGLSLGYFLDQPTWVSYPLGQAIGGLFLTTLVPVAAGVGLNSSGWLAADASANIQRLANLVFLLVVCATFVTQWPQISMHFAAVGMAVLALNVLTMGSGTLLGSLARLPVRSRIALAVECGIQNSALGITVAVSLLGTPAFAVPSVIYAFLMNVTALLLIAARQLQKHSVGSDVGVG
jgi:BASS family bile acid:Na+ symporter